jgi:hypothetical protein
VTKQILVFGERTFKVTVPDEAKMTFGPWSPPTEGKYGVSDRALIGTLRIYKGAKSSDNILAVFSGVKGFRDLSLEYAEEVAREEGAVIWKSDQNGYEREEKVQRHASWAPADPDTGLLTTTESEEDDL